jgi:hypothetical protein
MNFFKKKKPIKLGGNEKIVVIKGGKPVAELFYRVPTSDEILDYVWSAQNDLATDGDLKRLSNEGAKVKDMHLMVMHNFFLPFASKVFIGSSGFLGEDGELIDSLPVGEQFEAIKKTHAHLLEQMATIAYARDETVKKNG